MGKKTRLVLGGLAVALVVIATGVAVVCRERECLDRWMQDVDSILHGPPPAVIPEEGPEDGSPVPPTAPELAPPPTAPELAPPPTRPEPEPVRAAPGPDAGFYERLADLKRRFGEGATIQRVSRPAPTGRGAEPPPPLDWTADPMPPGIEHLLRWKLYLHGLPKDFLGDPALDPLHPDN